MTHRSKKLLEEAMSLSPEEREELGSALLDSVDDEELRETVLNRIAEIESGQATVHDALDVYHRLRARSIDE